MGGFTGLCRCVPGLIDGCHCRWWRHHLRSHLSDRLFRPAHLLCPGHQQALRRDRNYFFHGTVYQKRPCGLAPGWSRCSCGSGGFHGWYLAATANAGHRVKISPAGGAAGCGLCGFARSGMAGHTRFHPTVAAGLPCLGRILDRGCL